MTNPFRAGGRDDDNDQSNLEPTANNGAMPPLPLTLGIIPSNCWPVGHASLTPLCGGHQQATSASSIHNAYQMQTLATWLLLTYSL